MFGRLFQAGGVEQVSVDEAKRRQDAGALLLDVRELDEWRQVHPAGAKHIPLSEFRRRHPEIPRDREVLIICRSGNRSAAAARLLLSTGHDRVVNVSGGLLAWARQNLPLVP